VLARAVDDFRRGNIVQMDDDFDQDPSLWTSIRDYAATLGRWGWAVIVCGILGELATVILFFVALAHAPVPEGADAGIWLMLSLIVGALVAIPFFAFHQQRLEHISQVKSVSLRHAEQGKAWQEKLDDIEQSKKTAIANAGDRISRLEAENVRLQEVNTTLRDARDYRTSLTVQLRNETNPDGNAAQFRIEVTNRHTHRMVDNVRVRVVSLINADGTDPKDRLPLVKPLLAITGSGRPPQNAYKTECSIAALNSALFDLVLVHSGRRHNHSVAYGECEVWQPQPQHLHGPKWQLTHAALQSLGSGMYRIGIEVQGRDVEPVRREFVFWGDKNGPRCVEANDTEWQSAQPLSFHPADIELLPAEMHPHQLEALKRELAKPEYDGMLPSAVFWKINDDTHGLCGLSKSRFVPANNVDSVKEDRRDRVVIVTEDYLSRFPSGIPGFPNAVRRSDFDIAWKEVRG